MEPVLTRARAVHLVETALFMNVPARAKQFIRDLPILPKDEVPLEDNCPICLIPFSEIINDEENATTEGGECTSEAGKRGDEPEEVGVTRLNGCGHIFCRKDLAEWIRTLHTNCPACRSQFISAPTNPFGEDDASSDGGEYLPPSEGEEDIEVYDDIEYSEPDFWNGSDVESIPIVQPELEERGAMIEDEAIGMFDHDPYGDSREPDAEYGLEAEEPEYEHTGLVEEDYPPDLDSDVADPDFNPWAADDDVVIRETDSGLAVDDDSSFHPHQFLVEEEDELEIDPTLMADVDLAGSDFNPGLAEDAYTEPNLDSRHLDSDCVDSEYDPEHLEAGEETRGLYDPELEMDDASDDPDFVPNEFSENSDCELDSNCIEETDTADEATHEHDEGPEQYSDSEQEELEVEWGLTDGESNSSASCEDEVRGFALPVTPTISSN